MITKLAKAQENWIFKLIFVLVAISFISLFGVTGYLSSASQNRTVVNVNGEKTTQSEFSYRLQREITALKNLAGDDFELTEELRNSVADSVLKQIVDESVLDQTMLKYGIYFPKFFVQQVVLSQSQFRNPLNGQFNPELFKRYLSSLGMSEADYLASVKRLMGQRILVSDLVQTFNVPSVLTKAIHTMDNRRKTFKYVIITPDDVKIERKISDEEVKQYYEDFAENFMIPEQRDVEVLFIPNEVILKKYAATEDMISDYYKEHKKEFDQPEKREVLQMVFLDKDTAEKALERIKAGESFDAVAKDLKAENAAEPTLGEVSEDELAEDLASVVFEINMNEPQILNIADSWQVLDVKKIIPAKESTLEGVKEDIITTLNNENLYDALREARAYIDDSINEGKSLDDVSQFFGIKTVKVNNVKEETTVAEAPKELMGLTSTLDFNELAFSYGVDEVTSAEEFDDGIAVLKVLKITDAHMPEVADIKSDIIKLWIEEEKTALTKETAENILTDTADGSSLNEAAKARNLEVFRSEPLSRNDSFAGLSAAEMAELFVAAEGEIKSFEHTGNNFIIAEPVESVAYKDDLTEENTQEVKVRALRSLFSDMERAAMENYANDFKIKIDYERAGFSE